MHLQRPGEEPDQRGERRPVGPVQSWLRFGPAQDRVLVPKDENLLVSALTEFGSGEDLVEVGVATLVSYVDCGS